MLDLNALAVGQQFIALGGMQPSDDGNLLAYSTDVTGLSRVHAVRQGPAHRARSSPSTSTRSSSFAWAADGKTLFYVTEDAAKRAYRLWRHRLGQPAPRTRSSTRRRTSASASACSATRSRGTSSSDLGEPHRRPRCASSTPRTPTARLAADRAARDGSRVLRRSPRRSLLHPHQRRPARNFRVVTAPVDDPRRAELDRARPAPRRRHARGRRRLRRTCSSSREREDALPQLRVIDLRTSGSSTASSSPSRSTSVARRQPRVRHRRLPLRLSRRSSRRTRGSTTT